MIGEEELAEAIKEEQTLAAAAEIAEDDLDDDEDIGEDDDVMDDDEEITADPLEEMTFGPDDDVPPCESD